MRTILIGTSKFGRPVSDYYKALANEFVKFEYRVVFIFDGLVKTLPKDEQKRHYYTWPSKRPTKLKDFIFLFNIIRKHKPILCISNFGSANVMAIVSSILGVKNRIDYIHTTSQATLNNTNNVFQTNVKRIRKKGIYKLNTHFFANSQGTKNDIVKRFGVSKENITVFPILITGSKIAYKSQKLRNKELLIVGGLSPTKGHKYLIGQFLKCLTTFPNLILKIIGSGGLENELKQQVLKLNIITNVLFLGRVPNNEVQKCFSSSLLSISSSIDEAYGLVNIEALREGTPIICTKTAGSLDILNEGYNGECFYHNDIDSLSKSISKILKNWDKYSNNALMSFQNNYSIESNISKHANKIMEIINSE